MTSYSLKSLGHLAILMGAMQMQMGCVEPNDRDFEPGAGSGPVGSGGKTSSGGNNSAADWWVALPADDAAPLFGQDRAGNHTEEMIGASRE